MAEQDKRKEDKHLIDRIQSAGLLFATLAGKKFLYDKVRGRILPSVTENTYFQRYLKPISDYISGTKSKMRLGSVGARAIDEVYKNIAAGASMFSRHWNLLPGDKILIQNIARTSELGSLETPERNFVHRVIRRINSGYYEQHHNDDEKLFKLFRELVDDGLNTSSALRATMSEEFDTLRKEKDIVISENRRAMGLSTIGDLLNKNKRFPLYNMSEQETLPSNEIERKWRLLTDPQRSLARGPVLPIDEPLKVSEERESRFVTVEALSRPSMHFLGKKSDINSFIQQLSMTKADREAVSFFKELDSLLAAELHTYHAPPNIRYKLNKHSSVGMEAVVEIGFPIPGEPKEPLRIKIPITVNGTAVKNGTAWVLHQVRDLPTMLPGYQNRDLNFYDIMLGNIRKAFGTNVWTRYGAGRTIEATEILQRVIVDDSFKAIRQLATSQPLQVEVAKGTVIDLFRRVETGNFAPGLTDKWMVSGRLNSMSRLKRELLKSRNNPSAPKTYFVLDFETFPSDDRPHQISLLYVKNGEIVDLYRGDINPNSKAFKKLDYNDYTYPENDLRLSFGGRSAAGIKRRLEGRNGGLNELDAIRGEVGKFVRKHVPDGTRVPIVAYGHSFEQKVINNFFPELQSLVSDWHDPMDFFKAVMPSLANKSISQQNIGVEFGYLFLDKKLGRYRPTKAFIDMIRNNGQLLDLLEKNGKREEVQFARKIRMAVSDEALENLTLHMATMDTIFTNELLVKKYKILKEHGSEINAKLAQAIYRITHGPSGINNPVAMANMAIDPVGDLYHSASVNAMLGGKIPTFDTTTMLPLTSFGIDSSRPWTQRVMGAQFVKNFYPSLITESYKGIRDKYGSLFRTITVLNIDSPFTRRDSSIIDVSTISKSGVIGYNHRVEIKNVSTVKFHESIAELIKDLNNTTPERRKDVINRHNKKIQKALSRNSRITGWLNGGTTFAESENTRYKTKGQVFSVLENIEWNREADEAVFIWKTADNPGRGSYPVKVQIGTHKGIAGIATNLGYDAVVNLNLAKRGRSDAILGHILRVSENLQDMYRSATLRKQPMFKMIVQEFVDEVNKIGGLRIRPNYGTYLQFIDDFSGKDLYYIDRSIVLANIEKFSRRGWVDFMTRFSSRIYHMRKSFGMEELAKGPVVAYWTAPSINETLSQEFKMRGNKTPFSKIPQAEKDMLLEGLEKERLDFLRRSAIGKDLSEEERVAISRLRPGAPRVIGKFGDSYGVITSAIFTRAFELAEPYHKGTTIRIPVADTLVVNESVAKRISRLRSPAQQDWYAFYRMSYDTLAYGALPDNRFPIVSSSQIKIPEAAGSLKELNKLVGKNATIYIPELNKYYRSGDNPPVDALDANGKLKPGLTQEVISPSRYMHVDSIQGMYGQNPRFVEFKLGDYKTYVPIPGLNQITGVNTPKETLSSGDVFRVVEKHTQAYHNMFIAQKAYNVAIEKGDQEAAKRATAGLILNEKKYREYLLFNKSVTLGMLSIDLPGVMGKVQTIYPTGLDEILGSANKHLSSGFGVQTMHLKSMGSDSFNKALESHRDVNGNFIGSTLKKYTSKSEFSRAVLNGDELLMMSLIRRPAESQNAWLDTWVRINKSGRGAIGLHQREQILSRYDPDGDLASFVFNTFEPEEKEKALANMQKEARRRRKESRALLGRVKRLEQNIQNFETTKDFDFKASIRKTVSKEIKELMFLQTEGLADIDLTEGGLYIAEPKDAARTMAGRKLLRKGEGYEFKFHAMNLAEFHPDLMADIAQKFESLKQEQWDGFKAQILTKTATPFGFRPAHELRIGMQALGGKDIVRKKNMLDKFYAKVTSLKKFSGPEAEELTYAFMNPTSASAAATMEKYMGDEFRDLAVRNEFAQIVHKMKLELGIDNVHNMIRGITKSVPNTAEMSRVWFDLSKEAFRKPLKDVGPLESILGKFKSGEARIGSMSKILGLSLATLMFTPEKAIHNEQVYTMTNLHQGKFPSRVHLQQSRPPAKGIKYWNDRGPGAGLTTSRVSLVTDRTTTV